MRIELYNPNESLKIEEDQILDHYKNHFFLLFLEKKNVQHSSNLQKLFKK